MIKLIKILTAAIGIMCIFTGCSKTDKLSDSYTEGMDYQYMYCDYYNFFPRQAEGEQGYYMLQGHYIYYVDKEENTVIPLCNKADCLHDKEENEDKYKQCNAYVENNGEVGIAYCDHYLYYICQESQENITEQEYVLYRMKEDGSAKEVLKKWDDGTRIDQWIVHRNALYYVEVSYKTGEKSTEQIFQIKSLPLKGIVKKEQIIYEPEEELNTKYVGWLQAYGNHIYFQVLGYMADDDKVDNDNYADYLYMKTLEYDVTDGTMHDIVVGEGQYVQGVTFWQGKILVTPWSPEKKDGEIGGSYISNLDGSDMEIYIEDIRQGEKLYSDGNYLYVSNNLLVYGGEDEKQIYKVFDKDKNLVDTLGMPIKGSGEPPIGNKDLMLLIIDSDNREFWTMSYFDKSTIGKYQGQPFEVQSITQVERAVLDINEEE